MTILTSWHTGEPWTEGKLNLFRISVDLESSELELWKYYFKCFNNSSQFKPNVNWVTCHVWCRSELIYLWFRHHFARWFLEFKQAVEKGNYDLAKEDKTPNPRRIPEFYTLTKIHKPTPVGRPIVSGCDGPTEKLSSFVDKLLQAIVQQSPRGRRTCFNGRNEPLYKYTSRVGNTHGMQSIRNILHKQTSYPYTITKANSWRKLIPVLWKNYLQNTWYSHRHENGSRLF